MIAGKAKLDTEWEVLLMDANNEKKAKEHEENRSRKKYVRAGVPIAVGVVLISAGAAFAWQSTMAKPDDGQMGSVSVQTAVDKGAGDVEDEKEPAASKGEDGQRVSTQPADSEKDSQAYSYNDASMDVLVHSDPFVEGGGPVEGSWSYVQFAGGAGTDEVNAQIKKRVESVAVETEELAKRTDEESYGNNVIDFQVSCDSIVDNFAFTHECAYVTNWGSHGWEEVSSRVYNLETGQEIAFWDACGMSESELKDLALKAVDSYITGTLSIDYGDRESAREEAAKTIQSDPVFLRTKDGVVIHFGSYSLERPYSDGLLDVMVVSNPGGPSVGSRVDLSLMTFGDSDE